MAIARKPLICHSNAAASHTVNRGRGGDADTAGTFSDGTSPGTYAADFVPGADATIELVASPTPDTSNSTSYTFTSVPLGDGATGQKSIVAVHLGANLAVPGLITCTIGGNTATPIIQHYGSSGNLRARAAIFLLDTSGVTSADIVVSTDVGGQHTRGGVRVYRAFGISETPTDTGQHDNATTLADTIAISDGGVAIGAVTGFVLTTTSWAGIAEKSDSQVESNTTISSACDAYPTGGAIALEATFGSAPTYAGAVFASFPPA